MTGNVGDKILIRMSIILCRFGKNRTENAFLNTHTNSCEEISSLNDSSKDFILEVKCLT
jgi:hypothetical protein